MEDLYQVNSKQSSFLTSIAACCYHSGEPVDFHRLRELSGGFEWKAA